jgi:hypothetical protein
MAWLLRRDGGRAAGLFSVISDQEGMVHLDAGRMSVDNLEAALADSADKGHVRLAKAPWSYVDALMHAAFRKAPPRPGSMRAEYLLDRADIVSGEPPAESPVCPIRGILPADPAGDPAILDGSAKLFEDRAFRSWLPPHEIARPHLQSFVNLTSSGLVLSKEASTERVTALMDASIDDLMASRWREVYARRMEEMAYVFHLQGREEPARMSYAVAGFLASPGERRAKDVSFLRVLVFRAFLPLMAQNAAREPASDPDRGLAEGSSRILDPSKVHEPGVPGAGSVEGPEGKGPPLIITS